MRPLRGINAPIGNDANLPPRPPPSSLTHAQYAARTVRGMLAAVCLDRTVFAVVAVRTDPVGR